MGGYGFDAERYARELEFSGVPWDAAAAQAAAMSKALLLPDAPLLTERHFELLMERFGLIDQRFEQIGQRFDQIDQRFQQIDQRFGHIEQRIDKIDQRLDRMDQRFHEVDGRFSEHDRRFIVVEQRLNLHTWMLGLIIITLVVPRLQAWFAFALYPGRQTRML